MLDKLGKICYNYNTVRRLYMEWLDKLTQHTLFPGQYIYKVEPIFNEYDIQKIRVTDVTFSINGLQNFYYTFPNGKNL